MHLEKIWIGHPYNSIPEYIWTNDHDRSSILEKIRLMAARYGVDEASARLCAQTERVKMNDGDALLKMWDHGSPFYRFWKRLDVLIIKHDLPYKTSVINERLEIQQKVHPSKAERIIHSYGCNNKEIQEGFKTFFCGPPEEVKILFTDKYGVPKTLAPSEDELNDMAVFRVMYS
jgi:hypothetical protein